jgi:hypothetical protein
MKKKKNDLMTTQEMIERLQKHGLKDDTSNWKDLLVLLGFCGVIVLLTVGLIWAGTW